MVKKLKGKVSPAKDQGQKKISSYFTSSASSNLFTTVKDGGARKTDRKCDSVNPLKKTSDARTSSSSSKTKLTVPPKSCSDSLKSGSNSQGITDESSDDSDLEIIENTPESKTNIRRNNIDDDSILSPDFIPSTPQIRVLDMSSSFLLPPSSLSLGRGSKSSLSILKGSKSSLSLLSSRSLSSKKTNIIKPKPLSLKSKLSSRTLLSKSKDEPLHALDNVDEEEKIVIRNEKNREVDVVMDGTAFKDYGKENKDRVGNSLSLKRSAMTGTGISPDPKRIITPDRKLVVIDARHCKANLIGKFDGNSPSLSESESDSSFSILQGSMINQKMKGGLKQPVKFDTSEMFDNSLELLVPVKEDASSDKKTKVAELTEDHGSIEESEAEIKVKKAEKLFSLSQEFCTDFADETESKKANEVIPETESKKANAVIPETESIKANAAIPETESIKANEVIPETEEVCGDLSPIEEESEAEVIKAEELFSLSQEFSIDFTDETESKKVNAVIPETEDKFDESLDNLFDDELAFSFDKMSPFKEQAAPNIPPTENKTVKRLLKESLGEDSFAAHGNFGRHIVTGVERDPYRGEVLLRITSFREKEERTCTLKGFWFQSAVSEGDIVHILYADHVDGHYTIDNTKGLVVINPDYLISGTSVVSGVFCRRKAVLNERFRGLDAGNKLMLIGSLVHQLFQEVVKDKITSRERLEKLVRQLLAQPKMLREMYGIGVSEAEIYDEMNNFLPRIHSWSQRYLGSGRVQAGAENQRRNQWKGNILEIQDIEENVWSPKFGVKGKIDLTIKTHHRGSTKVVPLELKTGRSSFSAEHRGQVTLYSMMSADRREDPKSGLLLYLKDGAMEEVPAGENEKKGLIQLRNEMISYLTAKPITVEGSTVQRPPNLPEPIDFEKACNGCAHLLTCTVYQKGIEETTPAPSHPMANLIPQTTGHLMQTHMEYFRLWCLLLHLEIAINKKDGAIRALWCQNAAKRESSGDCLSSMILDPSVGVEEKETGQFLHNFIRSPSHSSAVKLEAVGLQNSENVVVSSQNEIALCVGAIANFHSEGVHVVLDRNLKKYPSWRKKIFAVDRCEYQNTMSINFTNLARLLMDNPRATTLRSLIVDKTVPSFKKGLPQEIVAKGKSILKRLNKTQQRAVLRTLMAEDYSLLKGFPGTGKTSTIVALVELMVTLGHSVLVTAYTHSAVDNILLKLKACDVDFLRLGRVSRIHPDLVPYADERLTGSFKDVASLSEFYRSKLVVATTCLGVNHVLFTKRTFDFCIVDEASQVLQAAALGPLFHSSRFVLVGDPQQLPPVIQSSQAKDLGMAESLFMRLDQDSLGATSSLTEQYRMNGQIMKLANSLMYEGKLKCASAELELECVDLPNYKHMLGTTIVPDWVQRTLDPNIESSVVFLDTGGSAPEIRDCANAIINDKETSAVLTLIQTILKAGLSADDVGVITPYRAQVKNIRNSITKNVDMGHRVEVNTVDQYQGRDKNVVIYSCVRSGALQSEPGDILQDKRRLNVAITRAKYKLIMIGDMATLQLYGPFQILTSHLESSQVYKLKEGVDGFCWSEPT